MYHLLENEKRDKISQRVLRKKQLSPRSSRLLASQHFMNRNSTANSTLNGTK